MQIESCNTLFFSSLLYSHSSRSNVSFQVTSHISLPLIFIGLMYFAVWIAKTI